MTLRTLLSQSRAARLLRVDEFSEGDHPRDDAGRFAAAGGHASEAEGHATRARATAAGTTPAARASARKAESHAELSRAAASRGDVETARHHASEARRHADAVASKVAAAGLSKIKGAEVKSSDVVKPPPKSDAPTSKLNRAREQLATHGHLGYVGLEEAVRPSTGDVSKLTTVPNHSPAGFELSHQSQLDLRTHFNKALASLGLSDRDGANAKGMAQRAGEWLDREKVGEATQYAGHHTAAAGPSQVKIQLMSEIGGAYANHDTRTGRITLSKQAAEHLMTFTSMGAAAVADQHRRVSASAVDASGERLRSIGHVRLAIQATIGGYQTMAHEAVHGHGPDVRYERHGAVVEELTTELCAKHVTREALGMTHAESNFLYGSGYVWLVHDAADRIGRAAGAISSHELHAEMEHAAIRFKSMHASTHLSADEAVTKFVDHIDLDRLANAGHASPRSPLSPPERHQLKVKLVDIVSKLSLERDQGILSAGARAK